MKVAETGLPTKINPLRGREVIPDEEKRGGGSDDIGDISWNVPTVTINYPSNIQAGPGHNWANAISMADADRAQKASNTAPRSSRSPSSILLTRPELVTQAWDYFNNVQTKTRKYIPLIRPEDQPAIWLNKGTDGEVPGPEMKKYYYDPHQVQELSRAARHQVPDDGQAGEGRRHNNPGLGIWDLGFEIPSPESRIPSGVTECASGNGHRLVAAVVVACRSRRRRLRRRRRTPRRPFGKLRAGNPPSWNQNKRNVGLEVDAMQENIQKWNDSVFSFGELGFQEFETTKFLTDILKQNGFTVQHGVAGIPTAWTRSMGFGQAGDSPWARTSTIFRRAAQKPGVALPRADD